MTDRIEQTTDRLLLHRANHHEGIDLGKLQRAARKAGLAIQIVNGPSWEDTDATFPADLRYCPASRSWHAEGREIPRRTVSRRFTPRLSQRARWTSC